MTAARRQRPIKRGRQTRWVFTVSNSPNRGARGCRVQAAACRGVHEYRLTILVGVTKFFKFSAKTGNVAYSGSLEIPRPWSSIDLHRGKFRPTEPLAMRHNVGGPLRDVVITGYAVPNVVSQAFVEALSSAGCTGWSLFPVTVYDKQGVPAGAFHGFQVVGECGPIDWRKSQPVPVRLPGGVFPRLRGMYFTDGTWDGSDVFGPTENGFVFMTEKAVSVLKRSRISNLDAEPIEGVMTEIWPGDMQPGWKHLWGKKWENVSPVDLHPTS